MPSVRQTQGQPEPGLADISLDKLAYIILKARAFDAQAGVSDPDEASNATDDRAVSVLEGQIDDPTAEELHAAISSLSEDEETALVALAWIGRGDFAPEDWDQAAAQARESRSVPTAQYLMGTPLLGDYLEEGAAALGLNLTESECAALYHANAGDDG